MFLGSDVMIKSCPPKREENDSATTVEALIWTAVAFAAVFTAFLNIFLLYHEKMVKNIEKEIELLEALIKDFDCVLEDVGSELNLAEAEKEWVNSVRDVAGKARDCVTNFKRQNRGALFGWTAIFRVMPIYDAVCQIYAIRKRIRSLVNDKEEAAIAKNIYESMQKWRNMNIFVHGGYAREKKSGPAQRRKRGISCRSIVDLLSKSKDLFSGMEERWHIQLLCPLHAFLNDLSHLELETETEKCWKKEAEKLVADAMELISNYSWWVSTFTCTCICMKNIPIVSFMFKKDMERIFAAFYELLNRKIRYGFEFIDRATDKSILLWTPQNTYVNSMITAVRNIRTKLSMVEQRSNQIHELSYCAMH